MEFESFDNLEGLFEQIRRDQEAADQQVLPWQTEIKAGDYVYRKGPGFNIFSEILDDPEPRREELENYRFTRSYSIACEYGELGDIHISTVEGLLDETEFAEAKKSGWNYEPKPATADTLRLERLVEINLTPGSREILEAKHSKVWDTEELSNDYDVIGFIAPYVAVVRKTDGVVGSLEFQHSPRFYFNFVPDEKS